MSYCTGGSDSVAWTSPTGRNRVVDQFATGPAGAMTSGSVSAAAARTASAIALHPATLVAASAVRQTIRVLVIPDGNGGVGLLQLTPGASIEALSVSPPRLGAYTLVARDTAGQALLTTALVAGGGYSEPRSRSFFHTEIPARGVAGITIIRNGRTLITRDRNPNPPKLVVLDPRGGQTVGGQGSVTVHWRATTADTHPLLARVDYSADDGHTWRPLYLGPNPNHATLPARFLSAAYAARIRVVVEDGFNQTMAVSGRFTALGAPPMVAILSPGGGNQIVANASLYLSGEGFDDANRPLPGGRLSWYDGKRRLGGGLQISVSGMAPGKHSISLVGRDAQGRVGEASVSVLVLPVQTIRRLAPGQALPPLPHSPTDSPVATVTPTTLPIRGLPPSATPTATMILAAPTTTPATGPPASSTTSTSSPTASPTVAATQQPTATPTATETPLPVATSTATVTQTTVPAPSVGFSPQSMDFGQVNVAGNGASRDISLINDGPGPLSVSDAAIVPGPNTPAGVFTLTGNTCINGPVVPNGTCTLTVLFVPRITSQVDVTLSVTDTGVGSPQGVPLTGYGYRIQ